MILLAPLCLKSFVWLLRDDVAQLVSHLSEKDAELGRVLAQSLEVDYEITRLRIAIDANREFNDTLTGDTLRTLNLQLRIIRCQSAAEIEKELLEVMIEINRIRDGGDGETSERLIDGREDRSFNDWSR